MKKFMVIAEGRETSVGADFWETEPSGVLVFYRGTEDEDGRVCAFGRGAWEFVGEIKEEQP
jgi:hypothetical protein